VTASPIFLVARWRWGKLTGSAIVTTSTSQLHSRIEASGRLRRTLAWPHRGPSPGLGALLTALPLIAACATAGTRAPATSATKPTGAGPTAKPQAPTPATGWATRATPEALAGLIAEARGGCEAEAPQASACTELARVHHFALLAAADSAEVAVADGSGTQAPAANDHAAAGLAAAERALQLLAPELAGALGQPSAAPALPAIDRAHGQALYLWAVHRLQQARKDGFAQLSLWTPAVSAALEACRDSDPTLDHGGPERLLGMLRARPPSPLRRDLKASRAHFERALTVAPNYLITHVRFAEYYAVAAHEPALFAAELRRVLEADSGADGSVRPENELARKKARALLGRASELFE